jgi:hypothetical protein
MLEQKVTLMEAADGLKGGMFVYIKGYCKNEVRKVDGVEKVVYSQKSDVTLNSDIDYENTHTRSAEMLDAIEKDETLSITITRNCWIDEQNNEYPNKAKGRTLKTGIKEVITIHDKDFLEAVAKVRKGILDPEKKTDNMEKVGNSVYDNAVTGKVYFRNVFVNKKVSIDEQGEYPISCQKRITAVCDAIRDMLPISKYRSYTLDDETVEMVDGSFQPRFEYVALCKDKVSSSSSSEEKP